MFTHWVDFVRFPLDPDRAIRAEHRLDTKRADRFPSKEANWNWPNGYLVIESDVAWEWDDDVFEALCIGAYGSINIWTKKRVWCMRRQGNIEKLVFVQRDPPQSKP